VGLVLRRPREVWRCASALIARTSQNSAAWRQTQQLDRLLGCNIELEDELDEEVRIPHGAVSCIPHDLPGLAAHRLDGGGSRLFGHALEWGDGDRLVDEPVDVGGERAHSAESDHPSRAEVNHPSRWVPGGHAGSRRRMRAPRVIRRIACLQASRVG
jgi:hypothetical protein